jgi:hypothetical protein
MVHGGGAEAAVRTAGSIAGHMTAMSDVNHAASQLGCLQQLLELTTQLRLYCTYIQKFRPAHHRDLHQARASCARLSPLLLAREQYSAAAAMDLSQW